MDKFITHINKIETLETWKVWQTHTKYHWM